MQFQTDNMFPAIKCSPSNYQLFKKNDLFVKHALILKTILIMSSVVKELMKLVVTVLLNAVAFCLGCVAHFG